MDSPDYAIDVDVATRFLDDQSAPEDGRYVFAYTIRIHNRGSVPARLISSSAFASFFHNTSLRGSPRR